MQKKHLPMHIPLITNKAGKTHRSRATALRMFICVAVACFCASSCGQQAPGIAGNRPLHKGEKVIIVLQPLSYTGQFINTLKDSIPKYYPVTVQVAGNVDMPSNAWYAPRQRYKADVLLGFLQSLKPPQARLVLGITGKDISTRKGTNPDYGIMGFGLQPGDACVVSLYRLQKNNPSSGLLFQRLFKTVIHEMGHNFGLPHCPDNHCIMADAEGTLKQDNETGLCANCKKKLSLQ